MSNRRQRSAILERLEREGKTGNDYVFLVRNIEKREDKQYWVPVSGGVIASFISGSHEWKALGPAKSKKVRELIAEIDRAQAHIVGEKKRPDDDDSFEPLVGLDDLGLDGPRETRKASGRKKPDLSRLEQASPNLDDEENP